MANTDLSRPHVYVPGSSQRVLLLLHGTGADEHDLIRLGKLLDPSAHLLSPRGMYLEGNLNRFFERYPDGSFNEDSIDQAVTELSQFIGACKTEYGLAVKEFIAVGFSNGANTAAALVLRYPELLSATVLFGATKPYVTMPEVDLAGKLVWLANGDFDPYAPVAISAEYVESLKRLGAEVTWLRHDGGHQISPEHLEQISRQIT